MAIIDKELSGLIFKIDPSQCLAYPLGEMQMLSIPVSCNLSGTGKQIMVAGQGSCTLVPIAGSTPT